jgi:hypothetical protein
MIGNIGGGLFANDLAGEQTLNVGKAGEIAQEVTPFPGSAISSVTRTHNDTRSGSRPNPRLDAYFKLKIMTPPIQNVKQPA